MVLVFMRCLFGMDFNCSCAVCRYVYIGFHAVVQIHISTHTKQIKHFMNFNPNPKPIWMYMYRLRSATWPNECTLYMYVR